jgi:uncharacterized protein YjbJ (UPF0337 family)
MNKNIFQGDLKMLRGKVKEQWGKLTENDLLQFNGKREQLAGIIQKRYGLAKDVAEKQIREWEQKCASESHEEEPISANPRSRRF